MLKTKSVHSEISLDDGLRILATRFRGRGLPSTRYDVWMPNLGPSEPLVRGFLGGQMTWKDYTAAYRAELFEPAPVDSRNKTIRNHGQKFTLRLIKRLAASANVTILCHCDEDKQQCHRHLLRRYIERV